MFPADEASPSMMGRGLSAMSRACAFRAAPAQRGTGSWGALDPARDQLMALARAFAHETPLILGARVVVRCVLGGTPCS
jgi:hypothetical protein